MTIEEMKKTAFSINMKVLFKGKEYKIVTVNFSEYLIGINELEGSDEPNWKRCESVELIKE